MSTRLPKYKGKIKMFLTKNAILKDHDFLQELANTLFHRFGVNGLDTILLNMEPDYEASHDILQLLTDKLLDHAKTNGMYDTYVNNFFTALDQSPAKDDILEKLTGKLLDHARKTNMYDEYINKFLTALEKSPTKDVSLDKFSTILEEYRIETKKKSNQPWVEVVGDYYDEDEKRMKISFDWNDAFIKLLKQKGYPGENEDDLVQMWLQEIANQR
jgi:hypothetical protein